MTNVTVRFRRFLRANQGVEFTSLQMAERYQCTQANISHILRQLKQAGWKVETSNVGRRETRTVVYKVWEPREQ